ncbi:MAG: FkbM family methyltransferase [Candidatus Woesearchaeota archaeon]
MDILNPIRKMYFLLKKSRASIPLGSLSFCIISRLLRPSLTDVMKREIKQGMVVVDVGANIGYYSILASKLVGAKGRVYAFEPDEHNFEKMQKNLKANCCRNVSAFLFAVADKTKRVRLYVSHEDPSDHRTYYTKGRKTRSIKAVSLDGFIRENVGFVKIDVEGYEPMVFKGMQRLLKNPDIKIITEFQPHSLRDAGYTPDNYLKSYMNLGFKLFLVKERESQAQPISISYAYRWMPLNNRVNCNILCKR